MNQLRCNKQQQNIKCEHRRFLDFVTFTRKSMPTVGKRSALNFSSVNLNWTLDKGQKTLVNLDLNWKLSQHENGPEHETRLADPGLAKHEHLQADEAFQDLQQGDVCDRLAEALAPCSGKTSKSGPVPCYRGDNRPTSMISIISTISTIVSTCTGGRASYWRSRLHKHCGHWNRWPEASYIFLYRVLLMMMVLLFFIVLYKNRWSEASYVFALIAYCWWWWWWWWWSCCCWLLP